MSAWWWLNVLNSVRRPRRQAKCWGFSGWWILHSFCRTSSSGSCSFSTASLSLMYCLSVFQVQNKRTKKSGKVKIWHNHSKVNFFWTVTYKYCTLKTGKVFTSMDFYTHVYILLFSQLDQAIKPLLPPRGLPKFSFQWMCSGKTARTPLVLDCALC